MDAQRGICIIIRSTCPQRCINDSACSGRSGANEPLASRRPGTRRTSERGNRVLAIDDEPSMIEWLKILLEHEGYEVRTAMIGTRGEEIFKTWKPDVVVTDMLLPDADGLELLRKFKQIHADTEVIVVTGHGRGPEAG